MIRLSIVGNPASQGSHRAFVSKSTGRAVIVQSRAAKHKTWRSALIEAGTDAMDGRPVLDEPLWLTVTFRLPRPAKPKFREWPAVRPDCDKLLRSFDALTGIVWRDDSRIVAVTVAKVWCAPGEPPGADVVVETVADRAEKVFGGGVA